MKLEISSPTTAATVCCALATGIATVLATQGWLIGRARRGLAAHPAEPVERTADHAPEPNRPARLLVVGDSTGAGVGSGTQAQSLHGRLQGDFDGAVVVNRSCVGARVADVAAQLAPLQAVDARFELALVLVGGNDILRMTPLDRLADDARALVESLRPLARSVVWMGCADVGTAPCFIAPFSWLLSRRSRRAAKRLATAARHAGADFIDFVDHPLSAELRREPGRFFAADGAHPSGYAYGRCYEVLKERPNFSNFAATQQAAAAF